MDENEKPNNTINGPWERVRYDWLRRLSPEFQDKIRELYLHSAWMSKIVGTIENWPSLREEVLWGAIIELIRVNKEMEDKLIKIYNEGLPPITIKFPLEK